MRLGTFATFLSFSVLTAAGCFENPSVVLQDGLHVALEKFDLSHRHFQEGIVGYAFCSDGDVRYGRRLDEELDLSSLQFTTMSDLKASRIWYQIEELDLVESLDGSVCACTFEVDFIVEVVAMNGRVFDLAVDPYHHHVTLFIDRRIQWSGILTDESWNRLRESLIQ